MKSKLKIVNKKPELTEEEILSHMNFDRLVEESKSGSRKSIAYRNIKIASLVVGLLIIGLGVYFIGTRNQESQQDIPPSNSEISPHSDQKNEIGPVKKDSTIERKINPEPEKKIKETLSPNNPAVKEVNPERPNHKLDSLINRTPVYLPAVPVEGFTHLYEYFSSELIYPEAAVKDSIQGVVNVSFIINKEGQPQQIKILDSPSPLFDAEVMRLIGNMPAWKPATRDNLPVPSKISIPLTFRLEKVKEKE